MVSVASCLFPSYDLRALSFFLECIQLKLLIGAHMDSCIIQNIVTPRRILDLKLQKICWGQSIRNCCRGIYKQHSALKANSKHLYQYGATVIKIQFYFSLWRRRDLILERINCQSSSAFGIIISRLYNWSLC